MYAEWTRRQMAPPSYRDRKVLIMNLYRGFERNMLRDGPWKNFLDLLFEGIDLTADSRKGRMEWLERAFQGGHRAICRYLIGRGFTSLTLQGAYITLGKVDLLAFVDLCCGSLGDVKDPVVEWFLLKKGVQLRKKHNLVNPVIQVLKEGFQTSCLSNRVELVKELLRIEPKSASQMGFYFPVSFTIYDSIRVTPLGVLELLDTPKIETWTGKNQIGFAMQMEGTKDEWKMQKLNEIEIQAIRDIKAALIAHGADPDTLFAPDALNMLKWRGRYVSEVLIKRLIQGRANVNYQNQVGDTPLRLAIQGDQPVDIVRVLVDFGASIQAQSVGREDEVALRIIWNTLHGGNGHLLGLQAGLKLVKGLQNGLTPLTWILSELADEMLEVTHILLEYGPDIKPPDAGNKTAIFRAISPDDPDSVEWLIKNGADLAVSDYLGAAPLSMARLAVKITGYDDQIHLHNIG